MFNEIRTGFLLSVFAVFCVAPLAIAGTDSRSVNADGDRLAIHGYDPVAYFTMKKPVKGKPEFSFSWHGAKWQFAVAKHRDLFARAPEQYAPQFGGFCAMAMTRGVTAEVDPKVWTIVEGKLYLNYNRKAGKEFRANVNENIRKAERAWDKMN